MIRIVVVRENMSRADAPHNHAEEWDMPDDTLVGEVLLRMRDDFLVRVDRSIAWDVYIPHNATVERDADGAVSGIQKKAGAFDNRLASLFVEPPSALHPDGYAAISRWSNGPATLDLLSRYRHAASPTGEYVFATRYCPEARLQPLELYRSAVEQC